MGFEMKQADHLDAVDRRIVAALQDDASLSHAALAERVAASPASCWRRVRALTDRGVLVKAVYLVDAESVGRGVNVLCNVRIRRQDAREPFEDFVRSRGEIMECYSMSGEWDYLLRVVVTDVADYERFLMRTLLAHPAVATASSHFALAQVKCTTALPI